jgi:3-deoxy-7-phosphoheptulonate synthase
LDKYPEWILEPATTTADAVASIAREGAVKVAAIAGEAAALAHGLKVLKMGIETNPLNYTRFVIISRRIGERAPVPPSLGSGAPNKASLVFSVRDEPGALLGL